MKRGVPTGLCAISFLLVATFAIWRVSLQASWQTVAIIVAIGAPFALLFFWLASNAKREPHSEIGSALAALALLTVFTVFVLTIIPWRMPSLSDQIYTMLAFPTLMSTGVLAGVSWKLHRSQSR